MSLTDLQRETLVRVRTADRAGEWYRARGSGERVTLASLFRHGLIRRRIWRGKGADAAHEYRLSKVVTEGLAELEKVDEAVTDAVTNAAEEPKS